MKNVDKDIKSLKAKMAQYRFKIKTMTQKYNECQTQIKDIVNDEADIKKVS